MRRKVVLIGGSAGSFRPVCSLLRVLPARFPFPVVMVLHRLKTINAGFREALAAAVPGISVTEPCDKDEIENGRIYLAPANYHLCFEDTHTFSLSTDPAVQYSRPSIDVTFASAARIYGKHAMAIMLSGANKDGVAGSALICAKGGKVIAQDPSECEMETMPLETIRKTGCEKFSVQELTDILRAMV